ncbi:MAG TPA: MFS transporter [Symbiobacteriaceae bacterium]|nr:MFS transporter [Symbiobacteriaceae bacterium]
MKEQTWQRDLYILWACNFVLQMGFSLIMPFLPLYLEELNVHGPAVDLWSGIILSANFVVMAIFSPIWGGLSDRTGRKPMMLRSAFGMAAVVWVMGLATSVWHLLGLRLLQGVAAGFIPATMAYMAGIVPRERSGYALGLLGTGATAGVILGPLAGGILSQWIGYRPIFFLTSLSCLVAGVVVALTIKEQFTPKPRVKGEGIMGDFRLVGRYPIVLAMTVVLFMNTFSVLTAEPVLARFLKTLDAPLAWVSFLSGLVFSMTGVANLLVAPVAGKLSDRLGSKSLLVACLSGSAVLYIVQGFATATWQMIALRFILGIFTGGLMPAVSGLIARTAPRDLQGRIFGLTNSAIFLGNTLGPLVGGTVAAQFGLRAVFPVTGALLLADLAWVAFGVHEKPPAQTAAD